MSFPGVIILSFLFGCWCCPSVGHKTESEKDERCHRRLSLLSVPSLSLSFPLSLWLQLSFTNNNGTPKKEKEKVSLPSPAFPLSWASTSASLGFVSWFSVGLSISSPSRKWLTRVPYYVHYDSLPHAVPSVTIVMINRIFFQTSAQLLKPPFGHVSVKNQSLFPPFNLIKYF